MKKHIEDLLALGQIITIKVKDSYDTYDVEKADLDENLYTLTDGRIIYIAPDQIATAVKSKFQPDPRLGF